MTPSKHPDIEALRQMTELMPSYNPYYYDENHVMQLETVYGGGNSLGVFSNEHISTQVCTLEPNTQALEHTHPEREVLMVLEGELTIVFTDGLRSVKIKQYEVLVIDPNVPHYARNTEKTIVFASLMPFSKHFPRPQLNDQQ